VWEGLRQQSSSHLRGNPGGARADAEIDQVKRRYVDKMHLGHPQVLRNWFVPFMYSPIDVNLVHSPLIMRFQLLTV
jgi:hypothetical protein